MTMVTSMATAIRIGTTWRFDGLFFVYVHIDLVVNLVDIVLLIP